MGVVIGLVKLRGEFNGGGEIEEMMGTCLCMCREGAWVLQAQVVHGSRALEREKGSKWEEGDGKSEDVNVNPMYLSISPSS